jgi:hypothetical protein
MTDGNYKKNYKKKVPKKAPAEIECRNHPHCVRDNCHFMHPPPTKEVSIKTESNESKAPGQNSSEVKVKSELSEGIGPAVNAKEVVPATLCPHCSKDTRLPKSILKSAIKLEDLNAQFDSLVITSMSLPENNSQRFPSALLDAQRETGTGTGGTPHPPATINTPQSFGWSGPSSLPLPLATALFPKTPLSLKGSVQLTGTGTPATQGSSKANTPQSFEKPRPMNQPKVKSPDNYRECLQPAMREQEQRTPAAYVLANWGVSDHKAVSNPSLKQLSINSRNKEDMSHRLLACCRELPTDKGGSVVRFEFDDVWDGDELTYAASFMFTEIEEFASKLHVRLVAELKYKKASIQGDEIVVYYACQNGPTGYFRYYHA